MRHRPAGRLLAIGLLCAGSLLVSVAPAAWASCAQPPPVSPMVFSGTVLWTQREGRIAHVWTDDRRLVTVVGTPAGTGVTTVDRTYEVGVRYEFHPLNATDPFRDNICTRTHAIAPVAGHEPCHGKKRTVPVLDGLRLPYLVT